MSERDSEHTDAEVRVVDPARARGSLELRGTQRTEQSVLRQAGVGIANFDYCVDPVDAQNQLPGACLSGNIRPMAFVECGPAEIEANARRLLKAFEVRRGFILSSGCEIPPESKEENVAAMVAAARGA